MPELAKDSTLGGYRLVKLLQGAGERQVFLAVDRLDERRRVIVKTASLRQRPDVDRLAREFAAVRDAGGPGVAAGLEHATSLPQGLAYLVLQEHGPSLAAICAASPGGTLPLEAALAAVHGAAVALAQLHDRGWRHGDLKPGNLLCDRAGEIVLADLECAASLDDSPERAAGEGRIVGTPPFVAPELWSGGPGAGTPAADVWALGVTLYLLITGEYPFGQSDERAIAAAIQGGPPPRLAAMPELLQLLLNHLLCVERSSRPRNGGAAGQIIAIAAERLGNSLAAGKLELARLAAIVGDGESPLEPPTIAPATPLAPPPAPGSAMPPATPRAAPAPPPAPDDRPQRRPMGVGAASAPSASFPRPEGIGAAAESPSRGELWRRTRHLDVSSRYIDLRPKTSLSQGAPSAMPAPHVSLPAPVAKPSAVGAPAQIKRKAAARWYRRMNPQKNFPLSVVFSGKQIRIVGGSGLGIALGEREIELDPLDPVLSVEPWFPGCLISPPRAEVTVSEETAVCRFWITPLVCGDLSEACVTVRYRGKTVETLSTPAEVVTRTTAKVLAAMSLVTPAVSKSLDLAGWNIDEHLRRWVPQAADALIDLGPLQAGLLLGGALLTGAAFHLYVTRPLMSEEAEPGLLPQAG